MAVSARETYTLTALDFAQASDDVLREVADLGNEISRERTPEDPPLPFEALRSRVRSRPKTIEVWNWLARAQDGRLVASAYFVRYHEDSNRHLRDSGIEVLPAHRRRGIATRILREMVAAAGTEDDIVLSFWSNDRMPASSAFLERLGARVTLEMHINQLQLAELDRAMVRGWSALDPAGYRLEWIGGDVPDALVENVIVGYDAMNTAPRGTSAMRDWNTTADQIRDWDRSRRGAGRERRLVLAIQDATGETAGYTELVYDPKVPHLIQQQGTAVIPAHRGQGIGKWVKAAMLERALRDWPRATLVRTGNADSNAAMLAINTRLGFKPAWASRIWEIGIAGARRYVESAPA